MSEEAVKVEGQDEQTPVEVNSVLPEKKVKAEDSGNGLLAGLSEKYMEEFDEIKWAKLGARDPYWPCIIYHPTLAPQKNKCLAAWSKKGPKRENFYFSVRSPRIHLIHQPHTCAQTLADPLCCPQLPCQPLLVALCRELVLSVDSGARANSGACCAGLRWRAFWRPKAL